MVSQGTGKVINSSRQQKKIRVKFRWTRIPSVKFTTVAHWQQFIPLRTKNRTVAPTLFKTAGDSLTQTLSTCHRLGRAAVVCQIVSFDYLGLSRRYETHSCVKVKNTFIRKQLGNKVAKGFKHADHAIKMFPV